MSLSDMASVFFGNKEDKSKEEVTKEAKSSVDTIFIVKTFEKVSQKQTEQVEILKKTNIVVTQMADNIYNIAAKIGAQLTSIKEVEESLKQQAVQQQTDRQKQQAASEEASMEVRQALPADNQKPKDTKKETSMMDSLKKGFKLPFGNIIKTVFSGGISFQKKAGGFLLRGLTLFTNPIGLAVAVIGTIGFGIYKYFTDKEFRASVNNIFQTAKDFISEKFGQAKDLFGEYIVNPVVNFLSTVKDKFIDGIIALINAVPDFGLDKVKEIKTKLVDSVSGYKSTPAKQSKKEEPTPIPPGTSTAGAGRGSINPPMAVPDQELPKARDTEPVSGKTESALDVDLKKYVNVKDSSINLDDLDQAVKKRLAAVAYEYFNATGQKIQINSGFRDPKEQEELFKKYGSPRAAKPGKSKHEVGLAFDMNSGDANKAIAMGLFDKYGFHRPISAETWHVEPTEVKRSTPDNPVSPGQAVLVSNEGKATLPSDGKPINENELKQAIPAEGETKVPSLANVSTENITKPSAAASSIASGVSGSQSLSSSGGGYVAPASQSPNIGEGIVAASMNVESGYNQQNNPMISNIDNSSSNLSSSEQKPRFRIPSPVANRGSLDNNSYSYA